VTDTQILDWLISIAKEAPRPEYTGTGDGWQVMMLAIYVKPGESIRDALMRNYDIDNAGKVTP